MSRDASDDDEDDVLDLAASLGGSLMKDLLADLAVNEDDAQEWLHLEQLERELHHLDLTSAAAAAGEQHQTAAGMVVSSQAAAAQAFGTGMTMYSSNFLAPEETMDALDAWSLSLQKFTASSVATDFLQADSVRKQQQQQQPPAGPPPGMLAFSASSTAIMEDYDITSTATVPLPPPRGPPPGISATSATAGKQVISQAAAKLVQDLQTVQEETSSPQSTNKRSVVPPPVTLTQDQFKTPDEIRTPEELLENSALSRSEASTPLLVRQLQRGLEAVHETEVLQVGNDDDKEGEAAVVIQQHKTSRVPKPLPITPQNSMSYVPSTRAAPTPQPTPVASKPMNEASLTAAIPSMPLMPPVLAVPLPAWSQPPPPVLRRVVFANPHPAAVPVHAGQLASRYMTARDICYVVHSLMRPVLTAETAGLVSNYNLQYWTRHYPNPPPPDQKSTKEPTKDWIAHELASRAKKAQEWSESNKTLGTPSKTNVTRPRALVSVTHRTLNTTATTDRAGGDPLKQRAALWKARIYCDQAYQALQAVTDSWKLHGRAAAQTPLMKLFKCLGIGWQLMAAPMTASEPSTTSRDNTATDAAAEVHHQYSVDPTALQLLLQLAKGKVLLARVLEQALLPPTVIPVLMPVALELQCSSRTASNTLKSEELDVADDRVFGAWTAVLRTLPMIPGEVLLTTVSKIQQHPGTALATTARMQCVHALLQRGGELAAAAAASPDDSGAHNPAFAQQWAQTEQEFMSILA